MKRVIVFLADGFEEIEGLTVVDLLRRAQAEVVMVSVNGRMDVCGSHGIEVKADALFEKMDFTEEDMFVLPGGMPGTMHLMEHEGLGCLLKEMYKKQAALAAICAAPGVLGKLGLLQGKKAVCYPGCEENLTGAQVLAVPVVTDGTITTSRGMGTAIEFSLELVKRLFGEASSENLAKAIVYR